jgi:hypothetical protein
MKAHWSTSAPKFSTSNQNVRTNELPTDRSAQLAVADANIAIIRSQLRSSVQHAATQSLEARAGRFGAMSRCMCLGCALWMDSNAPGFIHLNRPRPNLFRNLPSALGIRIQPVVIAIEFGLVAVQPLFAHPGERRFGRDASYPGNNRRQRSPAD